MDGDEFMFDTEQGLSFGVLDDCGAWRVVARMLTVLDLWSDEFVLRDLWKFEIDEP